MAGPNHELPAAGPADCDESRGMFGQEPFLLLVIALAVLLGGFVKGVVGIGLPIVSIGVLSSVIDAHFALGIIMFPLMFTNLWQMVAASIGDQASKVLTNSFASTGVLQSTSTANGSGQ